MATHLELADVGYHVGEEGVAGNVERDPQTLGGGGGENTLFLETDCSEYYHSNSECKAKSHAFLVHCWCCKINDIENALKQCYFQDRTSLVVVSFPHPLQGQVFGLGMRQGCAVTASCSYSSLPCPQISGRADRTALHCRRKTGQRHGMGAGPSEEGLEWNSGNNGMT